MTKNCLIGTDIFNKAVQANIPKALKNHCTQFDVNTACVEETLHALETLTYYIGECISLNT